MSNSSHFLNIKLKNLLYSFNVGYEIILRSVNNVIDLRADINWESLRTTKNVRHKRVPQQDVYRTYIRENNRKPGP